MPSTRRTSSQRAFLLALGIGVSLPLAHATPAVAEDRVIELLSGGGTSNSAFFEGFSADGTRAFFATGESIAGTGDGDGAFDVYQAQGGQITLLTGSGAANGASFQGSSADGARVFFTTVESIPGTGDADGATDLYRAEGGVITLLSVGTGSSVSFQGTSADGSRAFFSTSASIAGTGDSDGAFDVYQARGGEITLLTGSGAATNAGLAGASADGTRVFFTTAENMAGSGDTDGANDVYQAHGGTISLLSGSGAATNALFQANSADGTRVFFTTAENMAGTGDADGATDVYQAQGGTISLLSGSGAATAVTFDGGNSADGTRVFFTTDEAIAGAGDGDSGEDVYRAQGGVITLISNSGSAADVTFGGLSADGTRVFFETSESIPGTGDADGTTDLYQAAGGMITLLSVGTGGAVGFEGASADGSRVFFDTAEAIAGTGDGDMAVDVYEAHAGAIGLLSGGAAEEGVFFQGASADGTRVFFDTFEAVPGTGDLDSGLDLYQSRLLPTATPPASALPASSPAPATPKKKCRKGQRLKKGKCVKRKRK